MAIGGGDEAPTHTSDLGSCGGDSCADSRQAITQYGKALSEKGVSDMATKLTPKMLEGKNLCKRAVRKFKRLYPRGLYVTEKNCLMVLTKSHFSKVDLSFVGDEFLNCREAFSLEDKLYGWDSEHFVKAFVKYWNRYRARQG